MDHFISILFHKSGPATYQSTSQYKATNLIFSIVQYRGCHFSTFEHGNIEAFSLQLPEDKYRCDPIAISMLLETVYSLNGREKTEIKLLSKIYQIWKEIKKF